MIYFRSNDLFYMCNLKESDRKKMDQILTKQYVYPLVMVMESVWCPLIGLLYKKFKLAIRKLVIIFITNKICSFLDINLIEDVTGVQYKLMKDSIY